MDSKCRFCGENKAELNVVDSETLKEISICKECFDNMCLIRGEEKCV